MKIFPSGQSPGRENQEENQESPQQILLLNSLGQTASVLPGPWCPWCRTAQELHGNAKFNTQVHNGREALEVFFFSLNACLTAWPFPECHSSRSSFSQKSWGSAGFPALTAAHISWRCSLTLWTFIYLLLWHWQALLRQVSSASYVHLETSARLKKQQWSHPFPLFQDAQQFLQNDWFVLFFFLTVTSSKCESWRN